MNRGSATLKSALYETGKRNELQLSITVDQAGASGARLKIADPNGSILLDSPVDFGESGDAFEIMFAWLREHGFLSRLAAAGHRLVHGGTRFRDPHRITPEFIPAIAQVLPLDPDHLP